MTDVSIAACAAQTNVAAKLVVAEQASLFINDDECGDWVLPLAGGLRFQSVNAMSALCFVVAGLQLLIKAETPIARAYGLMMCCVGLGSFSFHATSSLSAFLIDIVPMAVTASLMLFKAIHAVQADAGHGGVGAESTRWFISMGCGVFAVYTPWVMIVSGFSHFTVWGVWALLFGSMGTVFGVVSLAIFFQEDLMRGKPGFNLSLAIAAVLLGLGCTIHSFVPGMCVGWRTVVPLHACWHFFSAITANRCGHTLDTLTKLIEAIELEPKKKLWSSDSLLVRLLKRDSMPSQFSM